MTTREIHGRPDSLEVIHRGSKVEIDSLNDLFNGEDAAVYDRADFSGPVERVSIATNAPIEEGRYSGLSAVIQLEGPSPEVQRGRYTLPQSTLRPIERDPVKRFKGVPDPIGFGGQTGFGPFCGEGPMVEDGLTISKTVFNNVYIVETEIGLKTLVRVDQESRRVYLFNSRKLTGEINGQLCEVEVKTPLIQTVDREDIAEAFFKTLVQVVDFAVGLKQSQYSASHTYHERRTYQVGGPERRVLRPASETVVNELGGAATSPPAVNPGQPATHATTAQTQGNQHEDQLPSEEAPKVEDLRRRQEESGNEDRTGRRGSERFEPKLPEIELTPAGEVRLDDIGGLEDVKRQLSDVAISFQHADVMAHWGAKRPQGVLFFGPPGTGKTMLAQALGGEIGADTMIVKASDIYGMWMGQSERNMKKIFDDAKAHKGKLILFFDEIDAIIGTSGSDADAGFGNRTHEAVAGLFKQQLNTLSDENPNVLVVGATNFFDKIDPSLIRSGRFDIQVRVPMPDQPAREQIVSKMIDKHEANLGRQMFRLEEASIEELGILTDGLSGADINEVFRSLIMEKAMAEARSGIIQHERIILGTELADAIKRFKKARSDLTTS